MNGTSPLMREGALSRLGALRRHPAVAFARASLVVLIALNAAVSVWLIAEFEGQYTEGPPSPARFYALAGVDGEYTMIDVSIGSSKTVHHSRMSPSSELNAGSLTAVNDSSMTSSSSAGGS